MLPSRDLPSSASYWKGAGCHCTVIVGKHETEGRLWSGYKNGFAFLLCNSWVSIQNLHWTLARIGLNYPVELQTFGHCVLWNAKLRHGLSLWQVTTGCHFHGMTQCLRYTLYGVFYVCRILLYCYKCTNMYHLVISTALTMKYSHSYATPVFVII